MSNVTVTGTEQEVHSFLEEAMLKARRLRHVLMFMPKGDSICTRVR